MIARLVTINYIPEFHGLGRMVFLNTLGGDRICGIFGAVTPVYDKSRKGRNRKREEMMSNKLMQG